MQARHSRPLLAAAWLAAIPCLALAQEGAGETAAERPITAEEALYNADEMWKLEPAAQEEVDPCDQPEDPDIILVCRESVDPAQYMFERSPDRRPGGEHRTTGSGLPRVDLNDSCLNTRGRQNCNMGGWAPPPAIMVDFEELPETPEGSDAARWGGPTDADAVAARENRVGADAAPVEPQARPDIGLETQMGIEDEIYGP